MITAREGALLTAFFSECTHWVSNLITDREETFLMAFFSEHPLGV